MVYKTCCVFEKQINMKKLNLQESSSIVGGASLAR